MDTLCIYGGNQSLNPEIEGIFTYCLQNGSILGEGNIQLENSKLLNKTALELKDTYSEYIYSLNQIFIEKRLIYKNSVSLFFFSDLSNKRTEIFKTFTTICHVKILSDLIKIHHIKNIIIDSCTESFVHAFQSTINNQKVVTKNLITEKKSSVRQFLGRCLFALKLMIKRICLINYRINEPTQKDISNLFFSIFPLLLNREFKDEKYKTMVQDEDIYLVSVITDGMHQHQDIKTYNKQIKDLRDVPPHILLDHYINFGDLVQLIINTIRFERKKYSLQKRKYFFHGIDISQFIYQELDSSFMRIPRLLLYHKPLKRVFERFNIERFYYYLHEFSFGRFFTFVLKSEFPNIYTIGVQHGPAAERKLLYSLANNEADHGERNWIKKLPIPDSVYAEDKRSQKIYLKQGYKNVMVMKNIYRLDYLMNIERKKTSKFILIVPGLHDGISLLQKIYDEIKRSINIEFLLKPHPRSIAFKNGIPEMYQLPNLKIVGNHISNYLGSASEVIVTYSSVGEEALQLGIPTRIVCLPDRINESPLLDIYEQTNSKLINVVY